MCSSNRITDARCDGQRQHGPHHRLAFREPHLFGEDFFFFERHAPSCGTVNIRYINPICLMTLGHGEIKRQRKGLRDRWVERKKTKEREGKVLEVFSSRPLDRLRFAIFQVYFAAFNCPLPFPLSVWSLSLTLHGFRPCYWGVPQPTAIDLRSLTVAPVTFHRFQLFDNPPHHLSTRWSGIKSFTSTRAATWNAAFGVFLASNPIKALALLWDFFLLLHHSTAVMEMKDYEEIASEVGATWLTQRLLDGILVR